MSSTWRTPAENFDSTKGLIVQIRSSTSGRTRYVVTTERVNEFSEKENQRNCVLERKSTYFRFSVPLGEKISIIDRLDSELRTRKLRGRVVKIQEKDRVAVLLTIVNMKEFTFATQHSQQMFRYALDQGMCAQVAQKSRLYRHKKSFHLPKTGAKKLASHFTHDPYKVAPSEQPLTFQTNQGSHYLESHYGEFLQPLPLYNSWDSYYWYQVQQHALFSHCLAC